MDKYEIIRFKDGEFELDVNVSPEEDTVWLTQEEIGTLFEKDRSVITKHINKIFLENELLEIATRAKIAQVRIEGIELPQLKHIHVLKMGDSCSRTLKVKRKINYCNLDFVLSVG